MTVTMTVRKTEKKLDHGKRPFPSTPPRGPAEACPTTRCEDPARESELEEKKLEKQEWLEKNLPAETTYLSSPEKSASSKDAESPEACARKESAAEQPPAGPATGDDRAALAALLSKDADADSLCSSRKPSMEALSESGSGSPANNGGEKSPTSPSAYEQYLLEQPKALLNRALTGAELSTASTAAPPSFFGGGASSGSGDFRACSSSSASTSARRSGSGGTSEERNLSDDCSNPSISGEDASKGAAAGSEPVAERAERGAFGTPQPARQSTAGGKDKNGDVVMRDEKDAGTISRRPRAPSGSSPFAPTPEGVRGLVGSASPVRLVQANRDASLSGDSLFNDPLLEHRSPVLGAQVGFEAGCGAQEEPLDLDLAAQQQAAPQQPAATPAPAGGAAAAAAAAPEEQQQRHLIDNSLEAVIKREENSLEALIDACDVETAASSIDKTNVYPIFPHENFCATDCKSKMMKKVLGEIPGISFEFSTWRDNVINRDAYVEQQWQRKLAKKQVAFGQWEEEKLEALPAAIRRRREERTRAHALLLQQQSAPLPPNESAGGSCSSSGASGAGSSAATGADETRAALLRPFPGSEEAEEEQDEKEQEEREKLYPSELRGRACKQKNRTTVAGERFLTEFKMFDDVAAWARRPGHKAMVTIWADARKGHVELYGDRAGENTVSGNDSRHAALEERERRVREKFPQRGSQGKLRGITKAGQRAGSAGTGAGSKRSSSQQSNSGRECVGAAAVFWDYCGDRDDGKTGRAEAIPSVCIPYFGTAFGFRGQRLGEMLMTYVCESLDKTIWSADCHRAELAFRANEGGSASRAMRAQRIRRKNEKFRLYVPATAKAAPFWRKMGARDLAIAGKEAPEEQGDKKNGIHSEKPDRQAKPPQPCSEGVAENMGCFNPASTTLFRVDHKELLGRQKQPKLPQRPSTRQNAIQKRLTASWTFKAARRCEGSSSGRGCEQATSVGAGLVARCAAGLKRGSGEKFIPHSGLCSLGNASSELEGWSVLHEVVQREDARQAFGLAKALVEKGGCRLNAEDDEWHQTPIFYAANLNRADLIDYLIAKGANPNHVDINGQTALFYAAKHGSLETAVSLVERHGLDPQRMDNGGKTPLQYVKQVDKDGSHQKIVDFLTEAATRGRAGSESSVEMPFLPCGEQEEGNYVTGEASTKRRRTLRQRHMDGSAVCARGGVAVPAPSAPAPAAAVPAPSANEMAGSCFFPEGGGAIYYNGQWVDGAEAAAIMRAEAGGGSYGGDESEESSE